MVVESLTVVCECGTRTVVEWSRVSATLWHNITSCDCCGTSVTTLVDVDCSGCGQRHEITLS